MKDKERLKSIDTKEDFVHSVLEFGIDHINNLKLKELRVLLCYHFGSEKLKGIPNKVDLVEAVTVWHEHGDRKSVVFMPY